MAATPASALALPWLPSWARLLPIVSTNHGRVGAQWVMSAVGPSEHVNCYKKTQ